LKYLFIGAHLDDIELAAGGLIAKLVKKNKQIKMLVLSKSDYSDLNGDIMRTAEESLEEGYSAAKILGAELEVLDFPTKDVPYNSEVVEAIDGVIREFNPDHVFTHNPHDTHQSHINTAKATLSAARYIQNIYFYEPIFPSGRSPVAFNPDVYVNVEKTFHLKISALKAHKSQYEKYGDYWLDAIKARAISRGYENMMNYAECFELCRMELKV